MKRIETSLHYNSINPSRIGYAISDKRDCEDGFYLLEEIFWGNIEIEVLQEIERSNAMIKRVYLSNRTIINLREI